MGIIAQAQVAAGWPEQQEIPADGTVAIYHGLGAGAIDYNTPVNASPIPAWLDREGKFGAGLGPAGEGNAGFGSGGPGAGLGAAGLGEAGFGADLQQFITPEYPDGPHRFAAVGLDAAGNEVTPAEILASVTLAGVPDPPGAPTASAYDNGTDTLTLNWSLSKDDEG